MSRYVRMYVGESSTTTHSYILLFVSAYLPTARTVCLYGTIRNTVRSNKAIIIKAIWNHKTVGIYCVNNYQTEYWRLWCGRDDFVYPEKKTTVKAHTNHTRRVWMFNKSMKLLLIKFWGATNNIIYGVSCIYGICAFLIIYSVLFDNTLFLQANMCFDVYITIRDVTFPI